MNGKVLMLAIIFFGGFHVFYAFNRVQNFANIMYRLCAIQLGECHRLNGSPEAFRTVELINSPENLGEEPPIGSEEKYSD